jgi:cytochrome c biogenesis protein
MMNKTNRAFSRLKKLLLFFRSLKTTVFLVALLSAAGALSTFIPQSLGGAEYQALYGQALGSLIVKSGFYNFFSSPFFFTLAGLFFINLLACTVFRFSRELRKKTNRNFGPDILHGGLILFMAAALLSVLNRMDGSLMLTRGQTALLPNGNTLILDDLEYQHYENGRPKAWISYLTVLQDGQTLVKSYRLEVNHPLKLKGFSLYQNSYGVMGGTEYTVIQAVRDPGYTLVLFSFIVTGAGICITLFNKLRRGRTPLAPSPAAASMEETKT